MFAKIINYLVSAKPTQALIGRNTNSPGARFPIFDSLYRNKLKGLDDTIVTT
ncbi:hypothetical protein ACQRD6_09375 [Prevotella sp. SGI.027]